MDFLIIATFNWGIFLDESNNVKYKHGTMIFLDHVKPVHFNRDWFEAFAYVCKDYGALDFYLKMQKDNLDCALRRLRSKSDVREMLKDVK